MEEDSTLEDPIRAEYATLAQRWYEVEATITYAERSVFPDRTEERIAILYYKPPDWREEERTSGAGNSTIQLGENFYICDGTANECVRLPPPAEGAGPRGPRFLNVPIMILFQIPANNPQRSTRVVADEEARCFSTDAVNSVTLQGPAEICWSEDGIILYASSSIVDGDRVITTSTIEVLDVERSVSPDDLQPPYPVRDFFAPTWTPTSQTR